MRATHYTVAVIVLYITTGAFVLGVGFGVLVGGCW